MSQERCNHDWIYDGKSCCYRLKCSHCERRTTAYHVKGSMPGVGDPVRLDGETIEVIGSQVK